MTHSVEKNENNESGVYGIETDQEWQTRQVRTARQYRAMEAFHGLMMGDYMGASMLDQKLAASHMIKNREVPDSPDSVSWPAEVAIQCTYNTIDAAKDDDMCTLVSKTFRYHKGDALVCAVGAIVLGAYWADDMDRVIAHTRAAIESATSEADTIIGGITMAVAAAWAWRLQHVFHSSHREFIDLVLAYVPPSALREQLVAARQLPDDLTGLGAAVKLGNVRGETPLDTIPFVIWCVGECLDDYEEAIWTALEARGASDVLCALVGGIMALHTGSEEIPDEWIPSEI
jgi:hypothetical protein